MFTSVMTPSGIDLVDVSVYDGEDQKTPVGLSDDVSQGPGSLEIPGFYREVCTCHTPYEKARFQRLTESYCDIFNEVF